MIISKEEDFSDLPIFGSKLPQVTVEQSSGKATSEQVYLPEVVNEHNLSKIELIGDPVCQEVRASFNAEKHKIGVSVLEMPQIEKSCAFTVLVISKSGSVVTYQKFVRLVPCSDDEC